MPDTGALVTHVVQVAGEDVTITANGHASLRDLASLALRAVGRDDDPAAWELRRPDGKVLDQSIAVYWLNRSDSLVLVPRAGEAA